MKKYKNIYGFPEKIVCKHKFSDENLKKLHYAANSVIFNYAQSYLYPYSAEKFLSEIEVIFKQIKELEVTDQAKAKKEELITIGRNIYSAISKENDNFTFDETTPEAINSIIKYQISKLMHLKEKNYNDVNAIINLVKENKNIYEKLYLPAINSTKYDFSAINIDNFKTAQKQLLNKIYNIMNKYSLIEEEECTM